MWRSSYDRVYTQALSQLTLEPGETWSRQGSWDQRDNSGWEVARGVYAIRGVVTTSGRRLGPIYSERLPVTLR